MLDERGIDLYLAGDRVKWRALPGRMTVLLLRGIKAYERDLVAMLRLAGEGTD